jgi:putative tricarboxylic transport membrane protein
VWALIASLYIGNVMLLVLNLPLVGLWVKLLKIPKPQLYAGILIFATVGAYGMRQSAFDLFLLYGIGLLGVLMRRFDFPDGARGGGHDPGAAGRGADAQRGVDRRRQLDGVPAAPDVADAAVIVLAVLILPRVVSWWQGKLARRRADA